MTDTFPKYRRAALLHLRELVARSRKPQFCEPINRVLGCLASTEFRSIALPVNGEFISRGTEVKLHGTDLRLPFPKFVLEYSMSDTGFEKLGGNIRQSAVLTIVNELVPGKRIEVCAVWCFQENKWNPSPVRVLLDEQTRIAILPTGAVRAEGLWPIANFGEPYGAEDIYALLNDYLDDLRVLVHFLMLCQSPQISLEEVDAAFEGKYTAVKCNGPVPFKWLPTSGLTST